MEISLEHMTKQTIKLRTLIAVDLFLKVSAIMAQLSVQKPQEPASLIVMAQLLNYKAYSNVDICLEAGK